MSTIDKMERRIELQREEIERLTECLAKANANHEEFERKWYLANDTIEHMDRVIVAAKRWVDAMKDGSDDGYSEELLKEATLKYIEHCYPGITTFPRTWTTKEGVVCSTSEPIPVGPPSGALNLGLIPEHDIHEQGGTKLECPSCNRSDHDFQWIGSGAIERLAPINACACGYRWRWKP